MKTIMCQTCLNVLKNKEVSKIRKKSRYVDFWRYSPSILINGVFRSKYITKLHYHNTDANCILHNHPKICAIYLELLEIPRRLHQLLEKKSQEIMTNRKKTSLCLTRYVPLTCFYTIIMQYAATKENFSHNFISVKKSGRDILTIFFKIYEFFAR